MKLERTSEQDIVNLTGSLNSEAVHASRPGSASGSSRSRTVSPGTRGILHGMIACASHAFGCLRPPPSPGLVSPRQLDAIAAVSSGEGRAHGLWCASSAASFTALSSGTEHLPICEHLLIWPASGLAES